MSEQTDQGRERDFPILRGWEDVKPGPTRIPWSVADKAYHVYSSRFGTSQSLERLAERGGFGADEMDTLYPGWRVEVSEITTLRAEVAALGERVRVLTEALQQIASLDRLSTGEWWCRVCKEYKGHKPNCIVGAALAGTGAATWPDSGTCAGAHDYEDVEMRDGTGDVFGRCRRCGHVRPGSPG